MRDYFHNLDPHNIEEHYYSYMATKEHPHNYWNIERCTKELSKYTRKLEAKYGSPGAYNSAYQHGWLETIAPHLISKTYWNREKCFQEVKEKSYKTKKEFREGSSGCYSYAYSHGFLEELCEGMEVLGNYDLRKVYVFEFADGYAYVGLTYRPSRRQWQHLNEKESPVFRHFHSKEHNFVFKVLSDWLKQKEAQEFEDHMINEYASKGWIMLNTKKGGGLGSAREWLYSLDDLMEESEKYNYRSEFRKGSPAKYAFAYEHGLLDLICAHMPKRYKPEPPIWTRKRIDDAVEECHRSRKLVESKYPGAYIAIRKMDLMEHYFGKKRVSGKIRTLEEAAKDCFKYRSTSELKHADNALYEYIMHKKWQSTCFKHMKRPKDKRIAEAFTWEDILDKIKRCSKLKEMRENYPSEYRAALRTPDWRERLYQMLPIRNRKTQEEVRQVCLQYHTPAELKKANLHIYNIVMRMHWQDKCFSHMKLAHIYRPPFTWEEVLEKIKLCSRLKEFTDNYLGEYHAALRRPEWKKKLYQMLPSNKKSSNIQ